jgi:2-polyprenyl-6-methoxyphenol hydroxylase-like FAD-dependent oxidoreductase
MGQLMKKPKIAIVGGGPGGLTLARILHVHGVEATVLERENSFTHRSQGGSLDMHPESGQLALARAELTAEFKQIARYEDQETRLYDKHGKVCLLDEDVTGKDRPEVDRGHLRQMLLDSLPEGMVRWGARATGIEPGADGTCDVIFPDGLRETYDVVVGADGTWSKVRPVLSDAQPIYSGVLFIEMGIDDVDRRYPDSAKIAGRGLTFALGDSKALAIHRNANAHIGFYAAFRKPADWFEAEGLNRLSPQDLRERLAAEFEGWSEDLLNFIHRSGDHVAARGIYGLPVGHRWTHRPGVTLLGDAAHVMSPFGGDGANFAMLDAADLADTLLREDWRDALPAYEEGICARAEGPAAGANGAIQEVFAPDGLEHMVAMFPERTRANGAEM